MNSYPRGAFVPLSADSARVIANLESAYGQWLDARRDHAALPVSMYWQSKAGSEYLAVKHASNDNGSTIGARSARTESQLREFSAEKAALKARIAALDSSIGERARQYRALRLPALPDRQAEILRRIDIERLLGTDLMVVGTNAFAAYEIACQARFPVGNEETEDFDLAWCRDTKVSLTSIAPGGSQATRPSLFSVLQGIDRTFRINPRKRYQAVNDAGYEVELLAAPSTHPLPEEEAFDPMASLVEQEWLLEGQPIACVVASVRHRACPLYVPDPRWMALHKLWLSEKPGRNRLKKPKDARQGHVLLDATRHFLADQYPLDVGFVLGLPGELRAVFDAWARERGFDPGAHDR